ncbi:MAG: hypothetical protein IJT44_08955 [Clostridia bacterium]|nr:hypothetical protein [Clostridia bacterium]
MKRILAAVFVICMMLAIRVPAFADGRGPAFTSYDVVCSKATTYYVRDWDNDGAWKKGGTVPAGASLTVRYEYEQDGVMYGVVQLTEDEWAYFRLSDLDVKDDAYLPSNDEKLPEPRTVRVIAKSGVPMYAGPNKKFSKTMTIPRGAKLTYSYGNDSSDYFRSWAYVTYLGRSGWIYVYATDMENGVAEVPPADEKAEIWVMDDGVKMFDGTSFGNIEDEFSDEWGKELKKERHAPADRVVGTLEKGKRYTYRYFHEYDLGTWYYVVAGLRSGWVFQKDYDSRVASPEIYGNGGYFSFKTIRLKLRETPDEKSDSVSVTIEKNTALNPEFVFHSNDEIYYYETIGGRSGWYTHEEIGTSTARTISPYYYEESGLGAGNERDEAAPIYDDILKKGKPIGHVPAGSYFDTLYVGDYRRTVDDVTEWTMFYYVQYDGVSGWVDVDDIRRPYEEEEAEEEEDLLEEDVSEEETDVWEDETFEDEALDDEYEFEDEAYEPEPYVSDALPSGGLSPIQIVLCSIGGAAALALTAAVTLLLIRRRREAKIAKDTEDITRSE